jgi:hypothetical protein
VDYRTIADHFVRKVEDEVRVASNDPQEAHKELMQTMSQLGFMSSPTQLWFLNDLNRDNPNTLKEIRKLLPELEINTKDKEPIGIHSFSEGVEGTAGRAVAPIVEEGRFGSDHNRDIIDSDFGFGADPHKVAAAINQELEALGDHDHRVSVEPGRQGDPDELVLRTKGHKTDVIVLPDRHFGQNIAK